MVLLNDSQQRLHVTGAAPSGTQLQIALYEWHPVLDCYWVLLLSRLRQGRVLRPSCTSQHHRPRPGELLCGHAAAYADHPDNARRRPDKRFKFPGATPGAGR